MRKNICPGHCVVEKRKGLTPTTIHTTQSRFEREVFCITLEIQCLLTNRIRLLGRKRRVKEKGRNAVLIMQIFFGRWVGKSTWFFTKKWAVTVHFTTRSRFERETSAVVPARRDYHFTIGSRYNSLWWTREIQFINCHEHNLKAKN